MEELVSRIVYDEVDPETGKVARKRGPWKHAIIGQRAPLDCMWVRTEDKWVPVEEPKGEDAAHEQDDNAHLRRALRWLGDKQAAATGNKLGDGAAWMNTALDETKEVPDGQDGQA